MKKHSGVFFVNMIKSFFFLLFILLCRSAFAQPTAGTTGLLNIPSAKMQEDGRVMAGANFLPVALTPATWDYNTWNYYLNITFFPFMEISYRMTLFKLAGSNRFNNQDRSLSARFQLLKEKEFLPSLVIGSNDIYSSRGGFTVNKYFTSFYAVGTKKITVADQKLDATLGYMYSAAHDSLSSGIVGGLSWSPLVFPSLKLMAEFDSNAFNAGVGLLLFKQIYLYGMAHELKRFSGGFALLIDLKK
jgi:hypothetical protein